MERRNRIYLDLRLTYISMLRVKAWETGKVMATHEPKPGSLSKTLRYKIALPSEINARGVEAIITLQGQLYMRAPTRGLPPPSPHILAGESAVVAPLQSETLDQELEHPSNGELDSLNVTCTLFFPCPHLAAFSVLQRDALSSAPLGKTIEGQE